MKTFEITKEQILELINCSNKIKADYRLKEWFPQAFESELELNRWIKNDSQPNWLMYRDGNNIYGFDANGAWFYRNNESYSIQSQDRYATEKEVETALIAEANRRGFKEGANINCINLNVNIKTSDKACFVYNHKYNHIYFGGAKIFYNGKWAEICEEPIEVTLEEIAEKFGVNVEQLKIKK